MNVFIIERSLNGIFSALFISFTKKIRPVKIADGKIYAQEIGDKPIKILIDLSHAKRVESALIKYCGYDVINRMRTCLLCSEERTSLIVFNFAYAILNARKNICTNLSCSEISEFVFTEQKVWAERHQILGFLRFTESESGVIYAQYAPDNDITSIVAPHFLKRLSGIPFIIHDVKRNKIAISDGERLKLEKTELIATFTPSEDNEKFLKLWKKYYRTVNISERKNTTQQNGYMPVRYRKYMPETYETNL